MEKIINFETIRKFAYVNDGLLNGPIKGVVICFVGLGGMDMYGVDTYEGELYAQNGILYIYPYNNPWAWMNKQAVSYTDEIVDVLFEQYKLDENIPIVSCGGSMGGQSALVYSAYSKRTPVACVVNCPVCDAVFHYTERDDLPRTMYSALYNEEGTIEEALKGISPIHLIDKMPDIKYHIFHCDADSQVNIDVHSKTFVDKLKNKGYSVTFDVQHGREHCQLSLEMRKKFIEYTISNIKN